MLNVLGFGGDPWSDSGSMGDSFFSGVPLIFPLFFFLIIGLIVFVIIAGVSQQARTSGLLKDLRRFASELADYPADDTADRLVEYLRETDSFPVKRTQMEPFRVALGCYQLVMESETVQKDIKERLDRQYKRLGILDGEKFADEPVPRSTRHSSRTHHHDHDHM